MDSSDVMDMLSKLSDVGPKVMDLWGIDFLLIVDEEVPFITHNLQWSIPANTQRGEWSWIVGTNVEYAPPVHEGHMTRPAIKHPEKSKGQRWVTGNPFFDRTLDQTEAKLEDYLAMTLGDIG